MSVRKRSILKNLNLSKLKDKHLPRKNLPVLTTSGYLLAITANPVELKLKIYFPPPIAKDVGWSSSLNIKK